MRLPRVTFGGRTARPGRQPVERTQAGLEEEALGQNLLISIVISTIAGAVLQWAGLGLGAVLFGSFVAPPLVLTFVKVAR